MNNFTIRFKDGNSVTASMNATLEEAKNYYLGKPFELQEGKMTVAVEVKQNN